MGSTRIKSVLIDDRASVLATGIHDWENRFENGIWTYRKDDIISGLQSSYADLARQVKEKYGVAVTSLAAIGISGMMHGYLAFDKDWELLVPFRTWRNTITAQASDLLTKKFDFHIPQRWGVAHLGQAILNKEEHLPRLCHQTTVAGYVHYLLTGKNVVGLSEASAMFPLGKNKKEYDRKMCDIFNAFCLENGYELSLTDIYPQPLCAGENAGALTDAGAALLDISGNLRSGVPFCPPEGDGGTGMIASDCVRPGVGSVSMGTSAFAMAVLEKPLCGCYPEIDVMATPTGDPAVLVHCNNCTGEIDAWVRLIAEMLARLDTPIKKSQIYDMIYHSVKPMDDSTVVYNYISGEHITGVENGVPLMMRAPGSALSLDGVSRALVYSALGTLRIGMDVLYENEKLHLSYMTGHGGFFKTPVVGQTVTSAAMKLPVAVMDTAGEGGAWGMAVLALFSVDNTNGNTLEEFLEERIFADCQKTVIEADENAKADFDRFMKSFRAGLETERRASDTYAKA